MQLNAPRVALLSLAGLIIAWLLLGYWSPSRPISDETTSQGQQRKYPIGITSDTSPQRVNACIFVLCRNSDLAELVFTLETFERRFNHKYNYPYVIVNDLPFTREFMASVTGVVHFGKVPPQHWQYPLWIDQARATQSRKVLADKGIIYGDSESYRFMCRYFSGFFFRHPLTLPFDYYWRIEPGVDYTCDIPYDPFRFMHERKLLYGFTVALTEIPETIPSLWRSVASFVKANPALVSKSENNLRFIVTPEGKYNGCHFWSNFEIGSFSFFRSAQYTAFFEYLDLQGGFFYERWGDAPVHSIALSLFAPKDKIHFFDDVGYVHHPFGHCPASPSVLMHCDCDPQDSIDWTGSSCLRTWYAS